MRSTSESLALPPVLLREVCFVRAILLVSIVVVVVVGLDECDAGERKRARGDVTHVYKRIHFRL